ncbi:Helitron helicase [Phytophthora megakarya]|uniref:ATP-dependent DNA helicase n=1 Tax=Phytophthora megakarya TaxID=4795 RepID=A0A225WTM4_9STRA|nr:Helitron helicase [Phytophthora megakarya]
MSKDIYRTVEVVNQCLRDNNKEIEDFNGLPKLSDFSNLHTNGCASNRLIQTVLRYDRTAMAGLRYQGGNLNDGQMSLIRWKHCSGGSITGNCANSTKRRKNGGLYFPTRVGPHIVFYVARSNRAESLHQASPIVRDEDPLMIKHGFHEVDRTLRYLMKNDKLLVGKVVLLAGTFRQILPVIPHGSPSEAMKSISKRSSLWRRLTVRHRMTNLRIQRMTDEGTAMETQSFAYFFPRVGEGRNEGCTQRIEDHTRYHNV